MLKRLWLLLALPLCNLMPLAVEGYCPTAYYESNRCETCYSNDCECGIGGGVDFFYWKPCVSAMDFVNVGVTGSSQHYEEMDPDWKFGLRAYVQVEGLWKCLDLFASYSWYKADTRDTVTGATGDLELTMPVYNQATALAVGNEARGTWDFEFQVFEIALRHNLQPEDCIFEYWGSGGLRAVLYKDERSDYLTDGADTVTQYREVDYWAVGPMLAFGFSAEICKGVTFFGTADGFIVIGELDKSMREVLTGGATADVTFEANERCYATPGWHFQQGLAGTMDFCGLIVEARIGWETWTWYNSPSYLAHTTAASAGSADHGNPRTLTVYGGFAGLALRF